MSRTSSASSVRTNTPRCGSWASSRNASRSVLRETPSRSATACSGSWVPGRSAPSMMRARRASASRDTVLVRSSRERAPVSPVSPESAEAPSCTISAPLPECSTIRTVPATAAPCLPLGPLLGKEGGRARTHRRSARRRRIRATAQPTRRQHRHKQRHRLSRQALADGHPQRLRQRFRGESLGDAVRPRVAGHRPDRTLRPAGTGPPPERPARRPHHRTPPRPVPADPADHRRDRPVGDRRTRADGPAARLPDGRGRRRAPLRHGPLRGRTGEDQGLRVERRHGRGLLRRGHLRGDRLDPADHRLRRLGVRAEARRPAHRAVGDPDRGLRVLDPRRTAAVPGPAAEPDGGPDPGGGPVIKVERVYWLCGAIFIAVGLLTFPDRTNARRFGSGAFWILLGGSFVYGTYVVNKTAPAAVLGVAVIAMAVLVATGQLGRGSATGPSRAEQEAGADRFGSRLFVPAQTIPVVVVIFAVLLMKIHVGGEPLQQKESEQ